jgi:hypothetical protein
MTNIPLPISYNPADYPDFYAPRDQQIAGLGAFYRHYDELDQTLQALYFSSRVSDNNPYRYLTFGLAPYFARAIQVSIHDNPHLSKLGNGALCDGNTLLIHRGLWEKLNNDLIGQKETFNPRVQWLAKAMMFAASHVLKVSSPIAVSPQNTYWTSAHFPEELDVANTITMVDPEDLYRALSAAYAPYASSRAVDEFCNRIYSDDISPTQRNQARLIDAVAQFKEDNIQTGLKTHQETYALFDNQSQVLMASPEFTPFRKLSPDDIAQYQFFLPSDAKYSIFLASYDFFKNHMQSDAYNYISVLQNNQMIEAPLADCFFTSGLLRYPNPMEEADKVKIAKKFAEHPGATRKSIDACVDGLSGVLLINDYVKAFETDMYVAEALQDIEATSIRKISPQNFKTRLDIGGNVVLRNLDAVIYYADKYKGNPDVYFSATWLAQYAHQNAIQQMPMIANPEHLKANLPDKEMDIAGKESFLLHAAKNRNALAVIDTLLNRNDMAGVTAQAVDKNNNTVAHLLLDNIAPRHVEHLQRVLIRLFERGLDPYAKNKDGYQAGEGAGERRHLLQRQVVDHAYSVFQRQALNEQPHTLQQRQVRQRL